MEALDTLTFRHGVTVEIHQDDPGGTDNPLALDVANSEDALGVIGWSNRHYNHPMQESWSSRRVADDVPREHDNETLRNAFREADAKVGSITAIHNSDGSRTGYLFTRRGRRMDEGYSNEILPGIVEEYELWSRGEVYFVVGKVAGEDRESIGGFIGYEYAEEEARELGEMIEQQEEERLAREWERIEQVYAA